MLHCYSCYKYYDCKKHSYQFVQFDVRVIASASPAGRLVVVPDAAHGDDQPLPEHGVRIVQMFKTNCDLFK